MRAEAGSGERAAGLGVGGARAEGTHGAASLAGGGGEGPGWGAVARGSDPGVPQDQASGAEVAGPRDRRGGMRWQSVAGRPERTGAVGQAGATLGKSERGSWRVGLGRLDRFPASCPGRRVRGVRTLLQGVWRSQPTRGQGSLRSKAVRPTGMGSGVVFPSDFPVLGQVFPWSGLFVLYSANENFQTSSNSDIYGQARI